MAITNLVSKLGIDFDSLYVRGKGTQTLGIRESSGVDIGSVYLAGDSRIDTGFIAKNGQDVGRLLADGANIAKVRIGNWPWEWSDNHDGNGMLNHVLTQMEKYESEKSKYRDLQAVEAIGQSTDKDNVVGHAIVVDASVFADTPGAIVDAQWLGSNHPFGMRVKRFTNTKIHVAIYGIGTSGHHGAFFHYCNIRIIINIPGVIYKTHEVKFGTW